MNYEILHICKDFHLCLITGCPEFCTSDYSPVCGTDGRTYSNRCELNRAKCNRRNTQLSVAYNGECDSGRGP